MKDINIRIVLDDAINRYSVYYNDTIVLECLAEDEVEELTLKEIEELWSN